MGGNAIQGKIVMQLNSDLITSDSLMLVTAPDRLFAFQTASAGDSSLRDTATTHHDEKEENQKIR